MGKNIKDDEKLGNEEAIQLLKKDISQFPLLTPEEVKELIPKIKSGDSEAKKQLINCNLRLVLSIAAKFAQKTKQLQIEDLFQEGCFGLIKAVEKYEANEATFATYATIWIQQTIRIAIKNTDLTIRRSAHFIEQRNKYYRFVEEYSDNFNKEPDDETITKALGISEQTLKLIQEDNSKMPISLSTPINDDEDSSLEQFIPSLEDEYTKVESEYSHDQMLQILKYYLSPAEYYILYYRALTDKPKVLEDIAPDFGATRERVRQIEVKAHKKAIRYLDLNTGAYKRAVEEIKNKYGHFADRLKTEPLNTLTVIKYLYLKDDLTIAERKLFTLLYFNDVELTKEEILKALSIEPTTYEELYASLIQKIKTKLNYPADFQQFRKRTLEEYKMTIFKQVLKKNRNNQFSLAFYNYTILPNDFTKKTEEKNFDLTNFSYSELQEYFGKEMNTLTDQERSILKRYLNNVKPSSTLSAKDLEMSIYLSHFGYQTYDTTLPLPLLRKTYRTKKYLFTEEQRLFIECYILESKEKEIFNKTYPGTARCLKVYERQVITSLEKAYFDLEDLTEKQLTRRMWGALRNRYYAEITKEEKKLLDMYFGITTSSLSISQIAIETAKKPEEILKILKNVKKRILTIEEDNHKTASLRQNYRYYIMSSTIKIDETTKKVLTLYILEGYSIEKIALKLNISKPQVQKIINEGLRQFDLHRFAMITNEYYSELMLKKLYSFSKEKFTLEEKAIIYSAKINQETEAEILKKYKVSSETYHKIMTKIKMLYIDYHTRNVSLSLEDILKEINNHPIESVISLSAKYILSAIYGLKTTYNPEGFSYSLNDILKNLNISEEEYNSIYNQALRQIKARKIGLIKPKKLYISRTSLQEYLNDPNLPLTATEKHLISQVYDLEEYHLKKHEKLEPIDLDQTNTIIENAIIKIFKYKFKEIPGYLDFEKDILPSLKYYSEIEKTIIKEYYQNGLTIKEISSKYHIPTKEIEDLLTRVNNGNNSQTIDFAYFKEAFKNPSLPYYGDLKTAIKIFNLYFGEENKKKMSLEDIKKELNFSGTYSQISQTLYDLIIAVLKLKIGIKKTNEFTYEEIKDYYERHKKDLSPELIIAFSCYFKQITSKSISFSKSIVSPELSYAILKEQHPNYFDINTITRQEIIDFIDKEKLPSEISNNLIAHFALTKRDVMSPKEQKIALLALKKLNALALEDDTIALKLMMHNHKSD